MISLTFRRGWRSEGMILCSILSSWGFLSLSAQEAGSSSEAGVVLRKADIQKVSPQKIKVTLSGEGARLRSYSISVEERPQGASLAGFITRQAVEYFNGGTSTEPSPYLIDNGPLDQNPEAGVFECVIDTANWPSGYYTLLATASNRPGTEYYEKDYRALQFTLGEQVDEAASKAHGIQNNLIYKRDGVYACFPYLYCMPGGELGLSFFTRTKRSHMDETGGAAQLVSEDEGRTWRTADKPLIDRDWLSKDGTVILADAYGWLHVPAEQEPELRKQHKQVMQVSAGVVAYRGGPRVRRSTDGGATWATEDIVMPAGCLGLMNHTPAAAQLRTKKGTRLTAMYGERLGKDDKPGKSEIYFLRSDDDGGSWSCAAMYPEGSPSPEIGFDETALGEAVDGTIIAMMRSSEEDYLWQANSKDGGVTWTPPQKTAIWGYPADLITLSDGRLLCAYGYRKSPKGIRVALSADNGKTWSPENGRIIRDDAVAHKGDLGYPVAYQRKDGAITLIYYITTDGKNTHIASSTFRVD